MRRRAREWREICSVCPPRCATILVYCSMRDWTHSLRHRIKIYPDSPLHMLSDSLRIYFFHSVERIYFFRIRCRIRRIRADGSRIRKEKVADSKISGYVWTGPKRCLLFQTDLRITDHRSRPQISTVTNAPS